MSEKQNRQQPAGPKQQDGDVITSKAPPPSSWEVAVTGGLIGGAIAGALMKWGGGQYMSWGTFVVFLFTMLGVEGSSQKTVAGFVFAAVAGLFVAIFK